MKYWLVEISSRRFRSLFPFWTCWHISHLKSQFQRSWGFFSKYCTFIFITTAKLCFQLIFSYFYLEWVTRMGGIRTWSFFYYSAIGFYHCIYNYCLLNITIYIILISVLKSTWHALFFLMVGAGTIRRGPAPTTTILFLTGVGECTCNKLLLAPHGDICGMMWLEAPSS